MNKFFKVQKLTLLLAFVMLSLATNAQTVKGKSQKVVNVSDLPEYVIVTSQNTKLIGGIDITIDSRNSKYEEQLDDLEDILQGRKAMKIRNQTDLLNAMVDLGFDYINAYNASGGGDYSNFQVNMVFRKKAEFRK